MKGAHPPLLREIKRGGKVVAYAKTPFGMKVYRHILNKRRLARRAARSRIVAMEDTFLCDRHAEGGWEAFVFVRYAGCRRSVVTLRSRTRIGIDRQVAAMAEKRGVKVIG